MRNIYLLKDLARLTGHSSHTLKYYLQFGLLKEIGRSPATNFRFFDDVTLERIKKIRQYRLNNISLTQIKKLLPKDEDRA